MTTKILGNQITDYTINTEQLSNTAIAAFAQTLAPKVLYANVANSLYYTIDDSAVNVGGGYIVITGAEFQSGASVLIDTVPASAVTYVNSTTLQVQVPARSAASYNLYVVNPDGGVGIKVAGITYSSEPLWVTTSPLANQVANTFFGVNFSATGATSYSVAAGSTLPAGTTLAANGYFSGTVSIGAQTTYTFSVVATDAELQDSPRTFQVTVTVIPQGALYSWGRNAEGQLGINDRTYKSSPTQVGAGTNWKDISTDQYQTVAIKSDGTLWTWGQGTQGQLGTSINTNRSSPVQVGTETNWSSISTGIYAVAAIKTDGTLWTWGRGGNGALGHNSTIYRSSPTQVGTNTTWSKVSFGRFVCAAVKTDGTLWTWGTISAGVLGLNNLNTGEKSSPTQVGTSTTWSLVSVGYYSVLATKTDGTLWSWGRNTEGQLGLGDRAVYRSSPAQVGSNTNWSSINTKEFACLSIKTDGTLWSWGFNSKGQLGLGDTVARSSPVQVGTGTDWSLVNVGFYHSLAAKTNGTLWSMGRNYEGQLGINNQNYQSSPTQIGSASNWKVLDAGQATSFAIASS